MSSTTFKFNYLSSVLLDPSVACGIIKSLFRELFSFPCFPWLHFLILLPLATTIITFLHFFSFSQSLNAAVTQASGTCPLILSFHTLNVVLYIQNYKYYSDWWVSNPPPSCGLFALFLLFTFTLYIITLVFWSLQQVLSVLSRSYFQGRKQILVNS